MPKYSSAKGRFPAHPCVNSENPHVIVVTTRPLEFPCMWNMNCEMEVTQVLHTRGFGADGTQVSQF